MQVIRAVVEGVISCDTCRVLYYSNPDAPGPCPVCEDRKLTIGKAERDSKADRERIKIVPREMEPCCECGQDYPRADLMRDNHIFCPEHRHAWPTAGAKSTHVCSKCGISRHSTADGISCVVEPGRERTDAKKTPHNICQPGGGVNGHHFFLRAGEYISGTHETICRRCGAYGTVTLRFETESEVHKQDFTGYGDHCGPGTCGG